VRGQVVVDDVTAGRSVWTEQSGWS